MYRENTSKRLRNNTSERLIEGLLGGEDWAWPSLVEQYEPKLRRHIRVRKQRHFSTSDVIQDAYVTISRYLPRFQYRGRGSLFAWMAKIVRHELVARKRKRTPNELSETKASTLRDGEERDPSAQLEKMELLQLQAQAMSRMRAEDRLIIEARMEGRSLREIAVGIERSPGYVTRRICLIMERLYRETILGLPGSTRA